MKVNLHLAAGGGVLFLGLLLAAGSLLRGIGSYPIDENAVLGLEVTDSDRRSLATAAQVDQPIIPTATGTRTRDPFSLKPAMKQVILRIPMPPPPRLDGPTPPVFPFREEQ